VLGFPELLNAQMSWAENRLLPAFDRMNADAKIYGKEDVVAEPGTVRAGPER
jgi:hypothetical protein